MWSQVLGGHVDITVDGGDPKAITKGGALRILATQSATREPGLPDVPAVAELVPGYDSRTWYGFLTTAGTPPDRVAFLYREMSAILAQPKSKEILATLGLDPVPGVTPEQFATLIRNELQTNGAAAKQFNIRPE
jgi:tripartite-type tricarboxylate transporter receptor subunit TctC